MTWGGGVNVPVRAPIAPPLAAPIRPYPVSLSSLLTVVASVQTFCGTLVLWTIGYAISRRGSDNQVEGLLINGLGTMHVRLSAGWWVPVLGLPLLGVVFGFWVLQRKPWPRIVLTAMGLANGAAWWGSMQNVLALGPIVYLAFCVILLWLPTVGRWLRGTGEWQGIR